MCIYLNATNSIFFNLISQIFLSFRVIFDDFGIENCIEKDIRIIASNRFSIQFFSLLSQEKNHSN